MTSDMFPDMPADDPRDYPKPSREQTVWFYVENATATMVLAVCSYSGEDIYVPYDLANPQMQLFNSKYTASKIARVHKGKVRLYPYNLDHFYSR